MVSNQETPQTRETPKEPTKRQQSRSRFSHLWVSRDTTLAGAKLLTIFKISRGEKKKKKQLINLQARLQQQQRNPRIFQSIRAVAVLWPSKQPTEWPGSNLALQPMGSQRYRGACRTYTGIRCRCALFGKLHQSA